MRVPPRPSPAPILVVDDYVDIREGLVELLRLLGHDAVGAASGEEALGLLREREVRPCLILLDLMLPGMTGRQFREEQLRDADLATIPVVFMSAYPKTLEVVRKGDAGAAGIVPKPVDASELLRIIGEHVGNASREQ